MGAGVNAAAKGLMVKIKADQVLAWE